MCLPACPNESFRAEQGHSIALAVHQIDELTHERNHWRDMFKTLCGSMGMDPEATILTLTSR